MKMQMVQIWFYTIKSGKIYTVYTRAFETIGTTKGQLISKYPFGFIVWTKIPMKLFLHFCPEFFCSFLGASWKIFGLPWDLVCNIINKEAYRKPQNASRKPPVRFKKFQGRNPEIISLVFLSKQ